MGRQTTSSGVRARDGHIEIDFYYNRIRCRERLLLEPTPKNMKYAAQLRAAILFEIDQGKFDYVKYFPNSKKIKLFALPANKTVSELVNAQLEIYTRRQQNNTLAKSTYISYKQAINRHILPGLGELKITELRAMDIKTWLYGFNNSAKLIRNTLIPLKQALSAALDDGLIASNPLEDLNLTSILKDIRLPKQDEIDPFNAEERSHLINNASGQFKNLVQFAFYSGLRTGELIALRWRDIDLDNNVIMVTNNKVKGEEKAPKTKSGIRKVLMLPKAKDALINQFQYTGPTNDFVFHNPNTNKPWSKDDKIRYHWLKLFKDKVVRYRYPYQTRHSYASMLLSNGENIAWIATQMGHINTEMVIKNYGKFIPDNDFMGGYKVKGNY